MTLQALSGAGYPGVASLDVTDNVIPYIGGGEEEKIESEPQKILGRFEGQAFAPARFPISASVHRVGVSDGHTLAVMASFQTRAARPKPSKRCVSWRGEPQERELPSAPESRCTCSTQTDRPQPRLDRDRERGMAVSVGRVRTDELFDLRSRRSSTTPSAGPPASPS